MSKKIIISNYDDLKNPYFGGGGAYVVHEIAKKLATEFDMTVITGKYPTCKNEIIDKVKYERIGFSKAGPKLGQLVYYFLLFFYFKFHSFDLWMESFTPPFSTNFLQLFTKKPVIGLVYMMVGADMKRKYKLPFDWVEKMGIRTYKYFIAPTQFAHKNISQLNPKANIKYIPNGINLKRTKEVNCGLKKHILYMGRIEINQKGLDLLLKAYSLIQNKTDFNLLIAGSGIPQQLNELNELIKRYRLTDNVKLLGKVSGKAKECLLSGSAFAIVPSRFETFSIMALEALSFGLPLITFDIDGLSWIPKSICIKIKKFDTKLLAKTMSELSKNIELRKQMSVMGKEYAKTYAWDRIFEQYKKFLYSIL